jgi:hypothetical protein
MGIYPRHRLAHYGMDGFCRIRNGNIEVHRQWMARNYAFTTIFVTVRVLNVLLIPEIYGHPPAWILLLATLICTDLGLGWRNVFTKVQSESVRRINGAVLPELIPRG